MAVASTAYFKCLACHALDYYVSQTTILLSMFLGLFSHTAGINICIIIFLMTSLFIIFTDLITKVALR